jgi:sulfoxide reductase catalytic subunit YedY
MISFDAAHKAVHYPEDRRFRIWINARTLLVIVSLVLAPLVLAWMQHMIFGLPQIAASSASAEGTVQASGSG